MNRKYQFFLFFFDEDIQRNLEIFFTMKTVAVSNIY